MMKIQIFLSTYYLDEDGDGFGKVQSIMARSQPDGYSYII